MSLLGGLLPGVYSLLYNVTGIQVGNLAAFNQIQSEFGVQVTGTAQNGFEVEIAVSNDGNNWVPVTYVASNGYYPILGFPCAYMQATVLTPPSSGNITVTVASK